MPKGDQQYLDLLGRYMKLIDVQAERPRTEDEEDELKYVESALDAKEEPFYKAGKARLLDELRTYARETKDSPIKAWRDLTDAQAQAGLDVVTKIQRNLDGASIKFARSGEFTGSTRAATEASVLHVAREALAELRKK